MATATERLREFTREVGCDWFGVANALPIEKELHELRGWLAEGCHGEMHWMSREPERRADPRQVVTDCRSVIVVGLNYLREPIESSDSAPPSGMGRISKYARTRDYHRVLEKILLRISRFIGDELVPGTLSRFYVDYGPVMERPWAARAGIGFLGKHTLLINPDAGSFHFLGVILTTAHLEPTPPAFSPGVDCGDCRRCIDACPTGAITEPWKLDARLCLSYLTIEKEGAVDPDLWADYQGNIFGCDICQDVCPYNRSRAKPTVESPLGDFLVPGEVSLSEMIQNPERLLESLKGKSSPLKRVSAESFLRNAVIVASENGDAASFDAMEERRDDPGTPLWLYAILEESMRRLRKKLHA